MNFTSFLDQWETPAWWQSRTVVCFSGPYYPLLFFALCMTRLKQADFGYLQVLDLAEVPTDSATAQLSSSFLGNRTYYWLKNLSDLDAKKRSYWMSYVQTYTGPHCLIFFCDKISMRQKSDSVMTIEVPEHFDQSTSVPIFNSLVPHDTRRCSLVVRTVFKSRRKITLDSICLLTRYMAVSGSDLELFLSSWLDTIIIPDSSLFDLSKYLLARNAQSFFRVWQKMAPMYGELFWIAYWGDIFWRAYHFVRLSSVGEYEQAKSYASRLPFTFVNGGWRTVSSDELKQALNYVYALDTDIKNGVSGYPFLELLYLKFFLRHFDVRHKLIA